MGHIEFLVEEPSMEAFLIEILPTLGIGTSTYTIHVHQGKTDLISKLLARLRGYAKWLLENARIVALVDRDNEDCAVLKKRLEADAAAAGLSTRSNTAEGWRVVNRIAIEELEAWFFGEWAVVRRAYPKVPNAISAKSAYRQSDAITGGTWEAFERILQRAGYFEGGLRKIEAAREIGRHFNPTECTSNSFQCFRSALLECIEIRPGN